MKKLENKVALVTACTRGIGYAIAGDVCPRGRPSIYGMPQYGSCQREGRCSKCRGLQGKDCVLRGSRQTEHEGHDKGPPLRTRAGLTYWLTTSAARAPGMTCRFSTPIMTSLPTMSTCISRACLSHLRKLFASLWRNRERLHNQYRLCCRHNPRHQSGCLRHE